MLGGLIFWAYPKITNSKFWWALLQPRISKIAGGGLLECKVVKWCGFAKICNQFCENKDKSFIIEEFSIAPISGVVRFNEWALTHLQESSRKGFPEIPLPITKIILEKGDVSLLAKQLPPLDYIELNRNSFVGSSWLVKANLGSQIQALGSIGDAINLKIEFFEFPLQIDKLASGIISSGQIQTINPSFGQSNFKLKLKNVKLKNIFYQNFKLPNTSLNTQIKLNNDLSQILEINELALKAGQIQIHSKPFSSELELEPIAASLLNKYIKNYRFKGLVQASLWPNYKNLKQSKALIKFSKLFISNKQFSALGPLKGELTYEKQKVTQFNLKTVKPINLITLQDYLKNSSVILNKGFLATDLKYNGFLQGNVELSKLEGSFQQIDFFDGQGKLEINNQDIKGPLKAHIGSQKDLIQAQTDLKLNNKKITGLIELKAKKLHLPNFKQIKEGQVNDLTALIKLNKNQLTSLEGQTQIDNLLLQEKKRIIKISQGHLKLAENKTLFIQNLKAALNETDWALIDGFVRFKDYTFKQIINSNDLNIQASGLAQSLFPLIPELDQIDNPQGGLSLKAHLHNNKFTKLKMLVSDLGGKFKQHKFKKANGSIELSQSDKLSFKEFNFDYGNSSELSLDGFFALNPQNNLINLLSSFEGNLQGIIYLKDILNENLQKKHQISFSEQAHFPINLKLKPSSGNNINFDFDSHFDSLGSISSKLLALSDDLPGYVIASGNINLQAQVFDLNRLETSLTGLNIVGKAQGSFNDFSFKAYTDPLINLNKIFKHINTIPIQGSLNGWVEGNKISLFDLKTLFQNLRLSLKTDEGESIAIGPLEFTSLETFFESKDNKGLATITAERGQFNNLVFSEINSSLVLSNNQLKMPGLSLDAAGGTITLNGDLDLNNYNGAFKGNAKKVNVGQLARGLAGLRGFSGIGNLTFITDGHILSLIKAEKPVLASGTFDLRNGNASQVVTLQKKLNLANLIFGGPLALNMNGLLGILAPESDGYYKTLSGSWKLNGNNIVFPEIRYRGTNELNLNMAGYLDRSTSQLDVNIIGSTPQTPKRVNASGQPSELLNLVSQINVTNVLGRFPLLNRIFDARPRAFRFRMRGNVNNQTELNSSASNSFTFLDRALSKNLPMPALPNK